MLPSRFRHQPRLETIEETHSDEIDLIPSSVPTHASGAELPHHELPSTLDMRTNPRDGSLTPSTARVIARNSISQSGATNESGGTNTSSGLPFTRPVSAGEDLSTGFKWAQATKPQLDLTRGRKGPAAGMQSDVPKPQPNSAQAVPSSNAAGELPRRLGVLFHVADMLSLHRCFHLRQASKESRYGHSLANCCTSHVQP